MMPCPYSQMTINNYQLSIINYQLSFVLCPLVRARRHQDLSLEREIYDAVPLQSNDN